MKILLVGFGYVGQTLAKILIESGNHVSAIRRSQLDTTLFPGLHIHRGDASDPRFLATIPADFEQIVCATSPDERTHDAYKRAYPNVVSCLLAAFPQARIILVSSTAVYDQCDGTALDETSPALATDATAVQIRVAEQYLLDQLGAHCPAHLVVRASGIYGPGRTRLISSLLHHDLMPEEQDIWTSRIHRDDLAESLHFLLEKKAESGIVLASDPNPTQLKELSAWVRTHAERGDLTPVPVALRQRKNRRLMPTRLLQLGYQFLYPSYAEGYRAILAKHTS